MIGLQALGTICMYPLKLLLRTKFFMVVTMLFAGISLPPALSQQAFRNDQVNAAEAQNGGAWVIGRGLSTVQAEVGLQGTR